MQPHTSGFWACTHEEKLPSPASAIYGQQPSTLKISHTGCSVPFQRVLCVRCINVSKVLVEVTAISSCLSPQLINMGNQRRWEWPEMGYPGAYVTVTYTSVEDICYAALMWHIDSAEMR